MPMRLDRFLRAVFGQGLLQGEIEKLCRKKQILVNQKPVEPKTRVLEKDEVAFNSGASHSFSKNCVSDEADGSSIAKCLLSIEGQTLAEGDRFMVVQDYPDFCVIYKPYGLPSQGGPGISCSVDQLMGNQYWIVHRLDRHTEGLMLLAKNRQTATALGDMFKKHQIQKYYYAVVRGCPKQDSGVINIPLKNLCVGGEDKMVPDSMGKKAVTRYRVVKQLNAHHSLVLLKPLTGRKHQLRVHMLTMGTPILGDMKYGKRAKRMHLYAHKIEFMWQGEKIRILCQ